MQVCKRTENARNVAVVGRAAGAAGDGSLLNISFSTAPTALGPAAAAAKARVAGACVLAARRPAVQSSAAQRRITWADSCCLTVQTQ